MGDAGLDLPKLNTSVMNHVEKHVLKIYKKKDKQKCLEYMMYELKEI